MFLFQALRTLLDVIPNLTLFPWRRNTTRFLLLGFLFRLLVGVRLFVRIFDFHYRFFDQMQLAFNIDLRLGRVVLHSGFQLLNFPACVLYCFLVLFHEISLHLVFFLQLIDD